MARAPLRGHRRRSRARGAAAHRLLRPRLGRSVPQLPYDETAGAHGERRRGARADLSALGWALAALWSAAGPAGGDAGGRAPRRAVALEQPVEAGAQRRLDL